MNKKAKHFALAVFAFIIIGFAAWLLFDELSKFSYRELKQGLADIPRFRIFIAIGLTAFSYWVLTFYDWLAIRYLGKTLTYPKTLLVSFTSYVMSYNLGLSSIGGTALRFRLYSSWGFGALEIAQLVAFCALSFWGGFFFTSGVVFMMGTFEIPSEFYLSLFQLRLIGAVLLAIVAGYLVLSWKWKTPIAIKSWSFQLPSPHLAIGQLIIGFADIAVAASVFYFLLPDGAPAFSVFLGIYLLATFAGMISHVPGGIGVFDTIILFLLKPWIDSPDIVGALLAYRAIYYFLPLILALGILGVNEATRWRKEVANIGGKVKRILPIVVPPLVSVASSISGALLLFTGATPSFSGRLAWLKNLFPLSVIEFSHFVGSLVGVLLLFLARGLYRRIDSAYVFSMILFFVGSTMAFAKGEFGAGGVLLFLTIVLLPCRHHFYRKASLFAQPLTVNWVITYAVIIGITIWLVSFSYKHVEYTNELWWQFTWKDSASRSLRAAMGAVILMFFLILTRFLAPVKPKRNSVTPEEMSLVREIVATSPVAESNLALLGDKSFLLSPSGKSFIMYAIEGDSWIAMGDPIGEPNEFEALVWKFRELSDQHNDRAVFYEVSTEHLPLYLEAGFSLTKIGEEAQVSLTGLSMDGSSRKKLRSTVRRLERDGCTFEFILREDAIALMPQLKAISEQWLELKNSAEKGFSLGFFDESYLSHHNFGTVKMNGEIVAFANLWESGSKTELSVDLMRFSKNAPNDCMEYLFIKLMLWSSENGYQTFSLGAAPLAGLDDHPLAPLWTRIGAQIYENGGHFYNFRGLRAYKDKFDPTWKPRYLATVGGLQVPQALTNVAKLVAGGWKKMLFH